MRRQSDSNLGREYIESKRTGKEVMRYVGVVVVGGRAGNVYIGLT